MAQESHQWLLPGGVSSAVQAAGEMMERLHQAGYIYPDTRPDVPGSAFKIKPICHGLNENHGYRFFVRVIGNDFIFYTPNRKVVQFRLALCTPGEQSVKLSVTIGLLCCGNSCLWLQDLSLTYFLGHTQLNAASGSSLRLKAPAYLWSKCVKWQATVSAPAVLWWLAVVASSLASCMAGVGTAAKKAIISLQAGFARSAATLL